MAAAAEPPRWTLRLRGLTSQYDHQFVYAYSTTTYLKVGDGKGLEAAVELRPSRHLGWELAAGRLKLDARLRVTRLQPVSFNPVVLREVTIFSSKGHYSIEPIGLALLFHPLDRRRIDFYVGPQVAWVRYNVDIEGGQERDPEPAYGAKLGAEYAFGRSPWSLGLEYRHLELLHEQMERDLYGNIGLDIGSLMIGYRFGSPRRSWEPRTGSRRSGFRPSSSPTTSPSSSW